MSHAPSTVVRDCIARYQNRSLPDMVWLFAAVSLLHAFSLDRGPRWIDEQITRELIQRWTAWELLTVLPLHQPHLPTYYFLPEFAGWHATVAVSLVSLPVTVLAGAAAARAHYQSDTAAVITAGLIAVSPYLAVQSTWIRMYAPLTALLTVGLWLGLDGQRWRATVVMLAAALLHPFAVFGGLWLSLLALKDQRWRLGAVTAVLACLPSLALVAVTTGGREISTRTTGMGHGIEPGLLKLVLTPVASLTGSPHASYQVAGVLAVTALLVWPRPDWRLLAWIVLPGAGLAVASMVHPVFRLKYYGFVAPAVAIVAANPRRTGWHRRSVLWVLVGLMAVAVFFRFAGGGVVTRRFLFGF